MFGQTGCLRLTYRKRVIGLMIAAITSLVA